MPLPEHGDGYIAERYKSPILLHGTANFGAGSTIAKFVAPFDARIYAIALYASSAYNGTVQIRVNGTVQTNWNLTVPSGSGGRVFTFVPAAVVNEGDFVEILAASGGSGSAVEATVTVIPKYVSPSLT